MSPSANFSANSNRYLVIARRYRPQSFEGLVGQESIVLTLKNAIESQRVGHAYLFTGARGVGKTSGARIFAKALNCIHGPTVDPCNACDSCLAVSTGEDIDVLEIDGASNRGIDEIRQLRANIGIRPSRSRFKIYIIDEVHMLSRDAFNALLKTLEEPPAHVKFIFCTTDVEKVPITVLSRCQRFDFAPIGMPQIVARLSEIVRTEGVSAEPAALELLARRAEGSLRDSQSLLEQALSNSPTGITVDTVHQLLGTARPERVIQVLGAVIDGDAASALRDLDQAIRDGVDIGQFCQQLLNMLRDTMILGVGCSEEVLLSTHAVERERLQGWVDAWGLPTLVNALQLLEQTYSRMRMSSHRRALLEVALVQLAHLRQLSDLVQLAREFTGETVAGSTGSSTKKKPIESTSTSNLSSPAPGTATRTLESAESTATRSSPSTPQPEFPAGPGTEVREPRSIPEQHVRLGEVNPGQPLPELLNNPPALWKRAIANLSGLAASAASEFRDVSFTPPDMLTVTFDDDVRANLCERTEQRQELERRLRELTGMALSVKIHVRTSDVVPAPRTPSMRERIAQSYQHPLVKQTVELFDAEVTRVITTAKDSIAPVPGE